MGQTPSKDAQYAELYSSYIQQQQNLIYQQQQQINSLFNTNLQNQMLQQQMPPNMFFQSDTNMMNSQAYAQQQTQQYQQSQQPQQYQQSHQQAQDQFPSQTTSTQLQLPSAKTKLDPYKILGIGKNYDEKTLKKSYLKAAMKAHPDRGGSPQAFQQVSIAFTLLQKKLKEKENSHSHNELRDGAKDFFSQQANTPKLNTKMTEKFDIDVFNQIYEKNKIPEVYDDGYGNWINENPALESGQTKMFQNGFNKDMFNATFENYKREQAQTNPQNALVKYQDPEVKISMSNADSIMTLGQGKITDFSGQSDNLTYTDYKQAFTDGSMLIDPSSVDTSGRANSVRSIKSQRSNVSYQMTQQDQIILAQQQALEEKAERDRVSRLNVYDKQHGEAYEKIHSMLLR
jgi:curved DNA-binding protein CbpA